MERKTLNINGIFFEKGFSILEVLVVMVIFFILAGLGGITLTSSIRKQELKNCGLRIIADLHYIKSLAQNRGTRAIFKLTTGDTLEDLDLDGKKEYYIAFLDKNKNGIFDSSIDEIVIHGHNNQPLCHKAITVDSGTTIRTLIFDPLGFLKIGATNRNIYLKMSNNAIRIELTSLTGMTKLFFNSDNCGSDSCSENDNWQEI